MKLQKAKKLLSTMQDARLEALQEHVAKLKAASLLSLGATKMIVAARCRPLSAEQSDKSDKGGESAVAVKDQAVVLVSPSTAEASTPFEFKLTRAFESEASQDDVYIELGGTLLEGAFGGLNV